MSPDYSLALEHFIDANRFWRRNSTAFWRSLRVGFAYAQIDADLHLVRQVTDGLDAIERGTTDRATISDAVYTAATVSPPSILNSEQWRVVAQLLGGLGFLRAVGHARQYCLAASVREFHHSRDTVSAKTVKRALCNAIERDDLNEIEALLRDVTVVARAPRMSNAGRQWLAHARRVPQDTTNDSPPDEAFRPLIRDRSVALVAPGIIDGDVGNEIEAHDIVYRIKYFGPLAPRSAQRAGTRCDIAFFNEHVLRGLVRQKVPTNAVFNGLGWIVQKKGRPIAVECASRVMSAWAPTALTTATSGTLALWDLLQFEPSMVRLYGFDFYSRRQQYDSAYLERYLTDPASVGGGFRGAHWSGDRLASSDIAWSFMSHVPLSDLRLVQKLHELGLVTADSPVAEVLGLSSDAYLSRLECMLGDW